MCAVGTRWQRHFVHAEQFGHTLLHCRSDRTQRAVATDRAAHRGGEDTRLDRLHLVHRLAAVRRSDRQLEAKRYRYGVLAVCPAGHAVIGMFDGERTEPVKDIAEYVEQNLMAPLSEVERAGLLDVLRRKPPNGHICRHSRRIGGPAR